MGHSVALVVPDLVGQLAHHDGPPRGVSGRSKVVILRAGMCGWDGRSTGDVAAAADPFCYAGTTVGLRVLFGQDARTCPVPC